MKKTNQQNAIITICIKIVILSLWLTPFLAQAKGVFDNLYKLPNAQTMTAANNYQPNVYILPNTQPTTKAGKALLKHLVASQSNATIESKLTTIKQHLQTALKQNDPVAQAIQATAYYYGWHSPKSPQAAYVLAQQASEQGEGQGDFILSLLLDTEQISTQHDINYRLNQIHSTKPKPNIVTLPNGDIKDLSVANQAAKGIALLSAQSKDKRIAKLQSVKHYLKQGVDKQHAQSQYEYGNSINRNLFKPIGLIPDNKTELTYFIKAADQGWPDAINDTSALYTLMSGMIDRKKANHYAQQLIDTKDMHYDKAWVMMIKNTYLNGQKEKAKALLDEGWALSKQSSASLAAQHNYFLDATNKEDIKTRLKWAKTANRLQNPKSNEYEVGIIFAVVGEYYLKKENGIDINTAKLWLNRAIAEGNVKSYSKLGSICNGYYGGKKDVACALENYKKGSELLDPIAMQNLATNYYDGEGVSKNYKKVFELTQKAAQMGVSRSMWLLASAYNNSIGVKRDDGQCYVWASLANMRQWQPKVTAQLKQQCGHSVFAGEKAHLQQTIQQLNQSIPIYKLNNPTVFK